MKKEWLKNIESGISKYKNEIVPLINQGYYGMAGMELRNAVFILALAIGTMEEDELNAHAAVLASRLSFLSKACLDEHNTGNNKATLGYAFNLVQEKIAEVELKITPPLLN